MKLTALILAIGIIGSAHAQTVAVGEPSPNAPTQESIGLKAQVLLDRAHFGVGEIDGVVGSTTRAAVKFFQQSRNLPITGKVDEATLAALEDGQPTLRSYTIVVGDVNASFGKAPKYRDSMEQLAEVLQTSPKLLKKLNPESTFAAGDVIQTPQVGAPLSGKIAKIVVTTSQKSLMVYDGSGKLMAYYPTTLGNDGSIPYGNHTIKSATKNPDYRRVLPNGKAKAMTGGPNNYVGNMWMALSKKHYGIHGSPEPSKIAKQQSAGCIRLTNWDANEVAAAIVKNTKVQVQR